MTNAESGMSGSLWLCATVDGTYVELGEMLDLKMKVDGKDIDTSNNGDGGWGSSIAGAKSCELSGGNNLIMSDDGYALLRRPCSRHRWKYTAKSCRAELRPCLLWGGLGYSG